MKYLTLFLFLLVSSIAVNAQEVSTDSTKSAVTKVVVTDEQEAAKEVTKEKKKEKEGFGDTLLSLGKGFLERLKYRFNLEAVENKVEKAQQKLKKKDKDSGGS